MSAPTLQAERLTLSLEPGKLVITDRPAPATGRSGSDRKKAILITRGSVTVRINKESSYFPKQRKRYISYRLSWRDLSGARQREKCPTLEAAKTRAEALCKDIQTGEASLGTFSQADKASYSRSLELLAKIGGPPLEVVAGIYAQLVLKLDGRGTPDQAIDFFLEHQPRGVAPKNIPALIADLLSDRKKMGAKEKWLGTLKQQLDRFAEKFTGPIHGLQAHEISAWLDSLTKRKGKKETSEAISLWTRGNYHAAVSELATFARAKGQLSKTWDELARVDDPEPPPVEVEVYTPDQLRRLLAHTFPNMIPFTILGAGAGIRHEEMSRRTKDKPLLDWKHIKLDRARITIKEVVGKTKKLRIIYLHPNIVAWLRPYAQPSGPVCIIKNPSNALVKAKRRAGLPCGRGELTNALRASFISHRLAETNDIGLTSKEAGNSPQVIAKHYLELVEPDQAKAYFDIFPPDDVLPLFAWQQSGTRVP